LWASHFLWWVGQEAEGKIRLGTMVAFCARRRNVGGSNLIGLASDLYIKVI